MNKHHLNRLNASSVVGELVSHTQRGQPSTQARAKSSLLTGSGPGGRQNRVTCIAGACHAGVIVLGTELGTVVAFSALQPNNQGEPATPAEQPRWVVTYAKAVHAHAVRHIAVHDGSLLLATGSDDGTVYVQPLDVLTRNQRADAHYCKRLSGHTLPVTALMWSTDGTMVVSSSFDKSVIVHSAIDGKQLALVQAPFPVTAMCFGPDETEIFVGGQGVARIDLLHSARIKNRSHLDDVRAGGSALLQLTWPSNAADGCQDDERQIDSKRAETSDDRFTHFVALTMKIIDSPKGVALRVRFGDPAARVYGVADDAMRAIVGGDEEMYEDHTWVFGGHRWMCASERGGLQCCEPTAARSACERLEGNLVDQLIKYAVPLACAASPSTAGWSLSYSSWWDPHVIVPTRGEPNDEYAVRLLAASSATDEQEIKETTQPVLHRGRRLETTTLTPREMKRREASERHHRLHVECTELAERLKALVAASNRKKVSRPIV